MKNNIEKNLKSFLKRRVKITLGMIVAFLITGTLTFSQDSIIVDGKGNIQNITDNILNIEKGNAMAVSVTNGGELHITSENINFNRKEGTNQGAGSPAIHIASTKLDGGNKQGGKLFLGGKNTEKINISSSATTGWAMGIKIRDEASTSTDQASSGSYVEINANNLIITTHSDNYYSTGILVQNTTTSSPKDKCAHLVINSENTIINSTSNIKNEKEGFSHGIVAFSQGKVEVKGNLEINADNVIETRGESTIKINENNNKTVKLNGDIVFSYSDETSKTTIDSDVTVNLSNKNSYLNGNIGTASDINPIPDDKKDVLGMKLGISNGAYWNTDANSFVNKLTFNNGIININGGSDHTVQIDKIIGEGGTINIKTSVIKDGFEAGNLVIKETDQTSKTKLDVNFTEITADNISTTEFKQLAEGHISGAGLANIDTTVKVEEGLTEGAITGSLDANGNLDTNTIKQNSSTSTIDGLQALSTNTYIAWKQEMNSLNKRMGELRDSSSTHGVWARVYGGESEYNSGYENKFQTYQVGYDKKYPTENGTLFAGYLVSYTQGDTDYSHNSTGSGDNTSIGAGIYGSWLGKDGSYLDVIFRVSRLENDYDIMSKTGVQSKGDYDTLGVNLGLEYGKRFTLDNNLFIEPSVEMNFGRVNSVDYTTSSGVRVDQDKIHSTEGRIGTALGYKFTKGNVYVRVAGVKEFDGKIDTTVNDKKISKDLGDSWLEYGIGMNYRIQENLNLYIDLERTGSAEVETNWQGNLGFRYEF